MTDKEIKTAIVYNEIPKGLNPDEKFKFEAYSALWDRIINVFINDEELEPINPNKN